MSEVDLPDGGRLAIADQGRGPPILLLRPVGGSLLSWGSFADALARHARVISFDARGTGGSSAAPLWTTTRGMAADALALLDALRIERSSVYGVSLGGMVACWLAIDAPQRVDRLVLASIRSRGWAPGAEGILDMLSLACCFLRPGNAADACLSARVLSPHFRAAHPERVAELARLARERPASRRGLLALLAAAAAHDIRTRLQDIDAETLVIAGALDEMVPLAAQRALADALPHGGMSIVSGAGHDVSAEAPAAVANLVVRFLHEPRRAAQVTDAPGSRSGRDRSPSPGSAAG